MLIVEGHAEETGIRGCRIPTEDFDIGALDFVVLGNTLVETIHEDGDCGDGQTTEGTDFAGFGNASSEVASQDGGFIGLEDLASHIGDGGIVVVVNDRELDVGVGFSGSLGGIADKEADGHDQIALFFDESVEVLLVIGNFFGLEVFAFDAELGLGVGDTLPCGCIEGFVIDTTGVGDLANLDLGFSWWLSYNGSLSWGGFRAGCEQHTGDKQNGQYGEQLFCHFFSNLLL